MARSCGVDAGRANSLDEVKRYADRAMGSGKPFLLEVPVDFEEYANLI
jgi:thiamine pyrophosphate-dependent acetolactate synthase large subunit-like protein